MSEGAHAITEGPSGHGLEQQNALVDLIEIADQTYRRRGDVTASSSSSLAERLAPRLDVSIEGSTLYELEWRLSRGLFVDGEQRPELYAMGALHGRRAVELNGGRVEGHFWTGVNLALHAEARQGLRGVLALLKARGELRRACAISEEYHGAGPLRVLGRLEHKSPKVLGGSLARSRRYYERALAIAPMNTVTLIYAAELEIDRGRHKRAAMLLETVISLPIDPDWEFENIRDKTLAKSVLGHLRTGEVNDQLAR
jgi:hypothetical protein